MNYGGKVFRSASAVGRTNKAELHGEKEQMLFERSEFICSRPAAQLSRISRRSGGFFYFLFSAGGKKEVPVRHEDKSAHLSINN
jgi:hypothetical protein